MSESLATPTKRACTSDLQMLAQVEKWMAAIREVSREERAEIKSPSQRLAHLLEPVTE
jgi:hypothetical protein